MASYTVSRKAIADARKLVDAKRYALDIACVDRASEWRHTSIELAAHRLLQRLDKTAG